MAARDYVSCPECGTCLAAGEEGGHVCDRRLWLDYQLVRLRPRIAALEADFNRWSASAAGRFAQYLVDRGLYGEPLGRGG